MIITAPYRDRNPRLAIIVGIVSSGLLLLLLALWHVQVMRGGHYDIRGDAQSLRRIRIPSARGEIVDRNGVVLANNRPSYDIAIYLDQLKRESKRQRIYSVAQASVGALSVKLGLPYTLSEASVTNHYYKRRPIPMPVWRDLKPETVAAFAERASTQPGADLIVMPVRQYPQGALAAHLLGFVAKAQQTGGDDEDVERFYYYQPDSVGKQGVELACDEYLRGAPGGKTIRVSPSGNLVEDLGEKKAERGCRVTLTIDASYQRIAEEALARAPLEGKELRGAVVVLDVRTGEVLASVSAPAFDPNIFNPGTPPPVITGIFNNPASPMLNRSIGAKYAPGSTFKTITLLAGLEAGMIAPSDTWECKGSLQIGNRVFKCHGTHGVVDAMKAIRESCDVWFYQEGMKMGADVIARMAGQFGFGQSTGIDVGRDVTGFVPSPAWKRMERGERWWPADTAQLSIGQSDLLVTPLQLACAAAQFATGGVRMRPCVVKKIHTISGEIVHDAVPEVAGRLNVRAQNLEFVRRAMLGAVNESDGTAHRAAVPGLSVAGKTGTAEYDVRIEGQTRRFNRAWFMGFAPYDKPQIAVAVMLEDARSGGGVAAPVAGEIFARMFQKKRSATGDSGVYAD